ncbi:MAG: hypothetical protein H0X41_09290 [Chitinophagaceae bacterium]|nr:hypothetical protein [Chitinophagaceae bacterium]
MNAIELAAFSDLFHAATLNCFGHAMAYSLSETESRLLSTRILEETGLVIGWKSLKNYSIYIAGEGNSKAENPSVSSLDTLARFVMHAPYTNEAERKKIAGHYPFWFEYKNHFALDITEESDNIGSVKETSVTKQKKPLYGKLFWLMLFSILLAGGIVYFEKTSDRKAFKADFSTVNLLKSGWSIKNPDTVYWSRHLENPGYLTLFTLRGDSWPDTLPIQPAIRNLVYRKLSGSAHFTTSIYMDDFLPSARWQQAGLILMEDTSPTAKNARISVAYNDEFGGYHQSPEIIVQVITSLGPGCDKPEEIAHHLLFKTDSIVANPGLTQNFNHTALRIERNGNHYRVLYASGASRNTAFHEVVTRDLSFNPKYAGIFALKGYVDDTAVMAVKFKSVEINAE